MDAIYSTWAFHLLLLCGVLVCRARRSVARLFQRRLPRFGQALPFHEGQRSTVAIHQRVAYRWTVPVLANQLQPILVQNLRGENNHTNVPKCFIDFRVRTLLHCEFSSIFALRLWSWNLSSNDMPITVSMHLIVMISYFHYSVMSVGMANVSLG